MLFRGAGYQPFTGRPEQPCTPRSQRPYAHVTARCGGWWTATPARPAWRSRRGAGAGMGGAGHCRTLPSVMDEADRRADAASAARSTSSRRWCWSRDRGLLHWDGSRGRLRGRLRRPAVDRPRRRGAGHGAATSSSAARSPPPWSPPTGSPARSSSRLRDVLTRPPGRFHCRRPGRQGCSGCRVGEQRRPRYAGSRTSRSGDRCASRGKSGLHRAGWWVTPTRGDPRESATENRPPRRSGGVRVKRRGKRPPHSR